MPSSFDFSDYLLRCVQDQLADIITFSPAVWLRGMALAVLICEIVAGATEVEEQYDFHGLAAGRTSTLAPFCTGSAHSCAWAG